MYSVLDEGHIVHELVGGEGGDSVEEEGGRLLKVPDRHRVQTLVYLNINNILTVEYPFLLEEKFFFLTLEIISEGFDLETPA